MTASAPTGPIACVLVPHFALRVALLARPELEGTPLVLGPAAHERAHVIDCSPEATRLGIRPGMSLREATALVPDIAIVEGDPGREHDVMAEILANLELLSPLVETAGPGRFYVDLTGTRRTLGPPKQAAEPLLAAVAPALRPRIGIAPGKFSAWVAARQAKPREVRYIPADAARDILAEVPTAWLPLPPEQLTLFDRLGLTTLGAIATLPKSAMAARFGPDGERAWRLATGESDADDRTVRPRPPVPIVTCHLDLPAPITSRDALFAAIGHLVRQAFSQPDLRGRHVRQARLRAHLEGGTSWERTLAQRDPVNADRLIEGITLRLESVEVPGVIESLSLELTGITSPVAHQELLLTELRPKRSQTLVEAIRQLKQRYGQSPIFRVLEVEPWSRIPERRHALVSYDP